MGTAPGCGTAFCGRIAGTGAIDASPDRRGKIQGPLGGDASALFGTCRGGISAILAGGMLRGRVAVGVGVRGYWSAYSARRLSERYAVYIALTRRMVKIWER